MNRRLKTCPVLPGLLLLLVLLPTRPASAHVEKGNMPPAVAEMEYRILLEFKPEDTATRSLLAMALFQQNKFEEAEKEFREVLRTAPDHFDARDGLGLCLLQQNRTTEALQELKTAAGMRPSDVMVHLHLGQALERANQPGQAAKSFRTGLDLLEKQPPSPAIDQQRQQFEAALRNLPVVAGPGTTTKE